jgi:hypothetical protein
MADLLETPNEKTAARWLSAPFRKYGDVFQTFRSLAVTAPMGAARVSKSYFDTWANFRNGVLSEQAAISDPEKSADANPL